MPVFYQGNAGKVIRLPDRAAQGAISMGRISAGEGGEEISFSEHRTIITRVGVSASGNYQFLHTIGNDVYVYVFGDRMGQITVHGLGFSAGCDPTGKRRRRVQLGNQVNNRAKSHGLELLARWYQKYRIANNREPVTITIGIETTIRGFVIGLNADVADTESRTAQFQLTLASLPI